MTTKELRDKLDKLCAEGHGEKKVGYFDHEYDDFWEIDDAFPEVDRDYDSKRRQEVIELW